MELWRQYEIGTLVVDKKRGQLTILDESPSMLHLAPVDAPHKSFWLPKGELQLKLNTKMEKHAAGGRLPIISGRTPVDSDNEWQAYLRDRAVIVMQCREEHLEKAVATVTKASGYDYPADHKGFQTNNGAATGSNWFPSLKLSWNGEIPDSLREDLMGYSKRNGDPVEIKSKGTSHLIACNSFIKDVLGLGFQFGA